MEREADWRSVMKMILREADSAGDDYEQLQREVRDRLLETVSLVAATPPSVHIFDEPYFPRPKGHMRRWAHDKNIYLEKQIFRNRKILLGSRSHCTIGITQRWSSAWAAGTW